MKKMSTRPQAVESRRLAVAGLFELLAGKSYESITISDICQQGGISRQTFYRNFGTKEDIITYYVDHVISIFMDQVEGVRENDLKLFFYNLPFSPVILKTLKENNLMHLMRDSMLELIRQFMETEIYQKPNESKYFDSYYARYLADTTISILETWVDRDFQETSPQLYEIMLELLQ